MGGLPRPDPYSDPRPTADVVAEVRGGLGAEPPAQPVDDMGAVLHEAAARRLAVDPVHRHERSAEGASAVDFPHLPDTPLAAPGRGVGRAGRRVG
ncbi:hypothetical protein GCM10010405_43640 [Streptomyces macrosporus]|uniref:Uncharacterized protein n=1 Tax=Streptomyces macrosporus TaxID=44032 RepID=A0ABN3KEJ4_9ACTN